MKTSVNNGTLTIFLDGHIDSTNSKSFEDAVMGILASQPHTGLVLDLSDLIYISSAGLRVMLKLRKKYPDLSLINASSEVYEIFDVTGFTEMMSVSKAFRKLSIDGCEVIGEGANGKVYRLDRDTIVKVYKDSESLSDIQRERELARTAFVLGIPTAIPYDVVRVGDSYGSVFELLNAKSFAELLREDPANMDFVVKKSVEIAKIMHETPAPKTLPDMEVSVLRWIEEVKDYLTPEEYDKFKGLIASLPKNGTMMHGDYHIKNIMQMGQETLLIDMDTLCKGHPVYELAFMYNAYRGFGIISDAAIENFLSLPIGTAKELWERSLKLYIDTDDEQTLRNSEDKAKLIGLLRVMRRAFRRGTGDPEYNKRLSAACCAEVKSLLSRIDSLEL